MLESIIIFAVIAAFLLYRLLSVLGQRTGEERPRPSPLEPLADQRLPEALSGADQALPFPAPCQRPVGEPRSLLEGVAELRQFDKNFDEHSFLSGARTAFEMIVKAFAEGDLETLRALLSESVFQDFKRAIDERGAPEPGAQVRALAADLADVRMDGPIALVTVRFRSERTGGKEILDLWAFSRDVRQKDPNWRLCKTRSGEI